MRKSRLLISRPRPAPPRFWRRISMRGGLCSRSQRRDWILVLSAAGVPWQICRFGARQHLYVPPLLEGLALAELAAYAHENLPRRARRSAWPLHEDWLLGPLLLLPLIAWHGMRSGWWAAPALFPDVKAWQDLGALDGIRIAFHSEWRRLATALTLHASLAHLIGNVFFGAVFLALLARLAGWGRAWLLTIFGGILGNGISVLAHGHAYSSLGFSTALFASVGACAGLLLCRTQERILLPAAAAIGLLAMLGTEGARADYAAHVCGLMAGGALGFCAGLAFRSRWPLLPQWLAAAFALALPAFAWGRAFGRW